MAGNWVAAHVEGAPGFGRVPFAGQQRVPLVELCAMPGGFLGDGLLDGWRNFPAEQDVRQGQDIEGPAQTVAGELRRQAGREAFEVLGGEETGFIRVFR